jgi:hypothetical protein
MENTSDIQVGKSRNGKPVARRQATGMPSSMGFTPTKQC